MARQKSMYDVANQYERIYRYEGDRNRRQGITNAPYSQRLSRAGSIARRYADAIKRQPQYRKDVQRSNGASWTADNRKYSRNAYMGLSKG